VDTLLGTWQITALLPGCTNPSQAATITFDADRLHFYAGCNRAMGSYRLDGDRLRAGPIALTMMYCPDMTVEQHLCTALAQPLHLALDAETLIANGISGGFQARRMPTPGAP
jgi:heat shock protein HslJ